MRARSFFGPILGLALAACGNNGGSGDNPAQAGTARSYTRNDSSVTVLPNTSGRFTATQVITISNDDAGASVGVVSLDNAAGTISSTAGSGGYQIQVTLSADGATDAQARQALATMTVNHRDATDPGKLYLYNSVQFAQYNDNNANRIATVTATLPSTLDYRLGEGIGAGAASTSGLSGSQADIESGAGDVTVSGDFARVQAWSGSGNVQLTVPSMRDTEATADTGAGTIDVTVTQTAGAGYDLVADTGAGAATVAVAGTTPNGQQSATHAHFTSLNYSGSHPQVRVSASSGAGSATIHD